MNIFKKDDICITTLKVKKFKGIKRYAKVRVISFKSFTEFDRIKYVYSVWNIDLERYEKIGERYLKLLKDETREYNINKILK